MYLSFTQNRCKASLHKVSCRQPTTFTFHRNILRRSLISEADISKCILSNGVVDFYELLGIDDDASQEQIKKAYRQLAKECHPDRLGQQGHDVCTLLNEAYYTLQHEQRRAVYNDVLQDSMDQILDGFTGRSISKWVPEVAPHMAKNCNADEDRGVWVDEASCIGCRNCIYTACGTFRMEEDFGRARVFAQWVDTEEDVQAAIDMCPVNCIHFVHRDDLPFFEYVTQVKYAIDRPNCGLMGSGMGNGVNLLNATYEFIDQYKAAQSVPATQAEQNVSANQRQSYARSIRIILNAQLGWLGGALTDLLTQIMPDTEVVYDGTAIGKRKRAHRRHQRIAQLAAEATPAELIPTHLALVPAQMYRTPPYVFTRFTPATQAVQ